MVDEDFFAFACPALLVLSALLSNAPSIRFSKNQSLSSYILAGILLIGLFLKNFSLGEGSIFILPLLLICVGLPGILVCVAGIVLSSVVIVGINKPEKDAIRYSSFALWIVRRVGKLIRGYFFD